MTERSNLLESIASTASDYRAGELDAPSPDHIERWIKQFDKDVRTPMLRELDHVLKQTYFPKKRVKSFLKGLILNKDLAGDDHCSFWRSTHFLDIQQNGHSQHELLAIFDIPLKAACGVTTAECGTEGGDFIYLDDVLFSGSRIGNDLEPWILNEAPPNGTIHIIVIAFHAFGEYKLKERLDRANKQSGKRLTIQVWRSITIENRNRYRRDAEVLWPAVVPDEEIYRNYVALPHRFPFTERPVGGGTGIFSSEEGRQLLERELLLAGLKIRDFCANPSSIMRPLGFSPFGLGFGSMIITFRNCPNNSPLALWWGDPDADQGHPFSHWYPLFPRKTYEDGGFDDEIIL